MTAGPNHGHDNENELVRVLRADPPPEALRWVTNVVGANQVDGVRALPGGSSAAMHLVTVRHGRGHQRVVLRRFLRHEQQAERPSRARLEANALEHVAAAPIPTPSLLGCDPDGRLTGVPTVLMTELPGQPCWDGQPRTRWAHQLAETAVAIHQLPLPAPCATRGYRRYGQQSYEPPRWAADRNTWDQAIHIFHGPTPAGPVCFIHRDFHPGNLLWQRSHLSGVVDWESASVGPPHVDLGHCRLNFFYGTADLADLLVRAWEQIAGASYNPWGDIVAVIGVLDSLRVTPPSRSAREALEDALARAISNVAPS